MQLSLTREKAPVTNSSCGHLFGLPLRVLLLYSDIILSTVIMSESVRKMLRAKLVVLGRDNCGKTGNTLLCLGGAWLVLMTRIDLFFSFELQLCVSDLSPDVSLESMNIKGVTQKKYKH